MAQSEMDLEQIQKETLLVATAIEKAIFPLEVSDLSRILGAMGMAGGLAMTLINSTEDAEMKKGFAEFMELKFLRAAEAFREAQA